MLCRSHPVTVYAHKPANHVKDKRMRHHRWQQEIKRKIEKKARGKGRERERDCSRERERKTEWVNKNSKEREEEEECCIGSCLCCVYLKQGRGEDYSPLVRREYSFPVLSKEHRTPEGRNRTFCLIPSFFLFLPSCVVLFFFVVSVVLIVSRRYISPKTKRKERETIDEKETSDLRANQQTPRAHRLFNRQMRGAASSR